VGIVDRFGVVNRVVHFLLVEDDPDHAELVRRSLLGEEVACTVDHVTDGVAALAYLRGESPYSENAAPDVILLDLHLPRLDGHELLAVLKSDPAWRETPVVVLTTSDAELDRRRAYQAHANSYLVKPVDFLDFRRLIQDIVYYWSVRNRPSGLRRAGPTA
jgi:CheY-like chemotaxis protein